MRTEDGICLSRLYWTLSFAPIPSVCRGDETSGMGGDRA